MSATTTRKKKPSSVVLARATWPEAEVIAEPVTEKKLTEPRVLIRRRVPEICGPNGEAMFVTHGAGTHVSLFTGAGGMDIGVEQAGFETVVQHEWDRTCCETLLCNRPNFFRHSALIQGDIRNTPTSMILKEGNLRVGEATLVTGGPPCQGFSTAGKRDPKDIRNTLVFEFLRVVREIQPKFFVMENVPGFVSMNKGSFVRDFLELAYHCFYELVYGLVNAVQYGVPQERTRFVCMGTRRDLADIDGIMGSLPKPQFFAKEDLKEMAWLERRPIFQNDLELMRHAPGIRYFPDRPFLVPPRPVTNWDEDASGRIGKGYQQFFDRLRREEPDRIVDGPVENPEYAS